jgi:hypothetical protein
MPFSRSILATTQRRFGRGPVRLVAETASDERSLFNDLELFAGTFVAGFLFVSILIG